MEQSPWVEVPTIRLERENVDQCANVSNMSVGIIAIVKFSIAMLKCRRMCKCCKASPDQSCGQIEMANIVVEY